MEYFKFVIPFLLPLMIVKDSTAELCSQQSVNHIADFLLTQITQKYPNSLLLPNISLDNILISFGTLDLTSGALSGLNTLKRNSDIETTLINGTTQIVGEIKFDNLTIIYKKFNLQVFVLKSSGNLRASVTDLTIQVRATMGNKSMCFITLESTNILKIGKFNIYLMSDCQFCTKISSALTTKVANLFKENITHLIQARINSTLKKSFNVNNNFVCSNMK